MVECPECDARLEPTGGCKKCGWAPKVEPVKPPAYREVQPRAWARCKPTDRCSEPGCTKSVAEHMAELRVLVAKIGRVS